MSKIPRSTKVSPDETDKFWTKLFGTTNNSFRALGRSPEISPASTATGRLRMPGVMAPKNQPEFWADAPWRLEPDRREIPISIYVRDANVDSPGYSPWRLDSIRVEQRLKNKKWHKLRTFLPQNLPDLDEQGLIKANFWVFSSSITLSEIKDTKVGEKAHLRVIFEGSAQPYEKISLVNRHLEIMLSQNGLPLGHAAHQSGPRNWFYGDTHYHSAYTNDIKEFGAPLPETRNAGLSIGLDWLIVTDHSCDLLLKDNEGSSESRWERLMADVSSPNLSDDRFRFILGEEITLIGHGEKYVHMLAMGGMQAAIQGAFLPEDSSSLAVDLWINAIKSIIRFGKGYPPDLIPSLFGKLHSFEEVLEMLPSNTLTFAAHPYSVAQIPPSKWDEKDLAHPHLTGHEFWNARVRKSAKLTDNPFARKGWSDPETLNQRDEDRITQLLQYVNDKWEPHLMCGVEEWVPGATLPLRRPVFIGGSDAHGDFNYHAGMAWDYTTADMIDDNALGRVRTSIFLPDHQTVSVPGVNEILAALKKGSCVVTDGPILEFHLQHKGQVAHMGDALLVSGDNDPEMKIVAHSTPEFGSVTQVELVTYFKGQKSKNPSTLKLEQGKQAIIQIAGTQGYYRLQAQTIGMEGERFCCFTNPIWLRITDGQAKKLRISFT